MKRINYLLLEIFTRKSHLCDLFIFWWVTESATKKIYIRTSHVWKMWLIEVTFGTTIVLRDLGENLSDKNMTLWWHEGRSKHNSKTLVQTTDITRVPIASYVHVMYHWRQRCCSEVLNNISPLVYSLGNNVISITC